MDWSARTRPVDTIESWLRRMTVTYAPPEGYAPHVSPEGLLLPVR